MAHFPVSYLQETGKTLMPNLCGNYVQEAGGKMSHDDEMKLVWAASSVMGGGLDTVSRLSS